MARKAGGTSRSTKTPAQAKLGRGTLGLLVTAPRYLFAAAWFGGGAYGFGFGLEDYAVKGGGSDEASAHDADPAQRESTVGTALPGTAAIVALEDHAGAVAGGQHALVGGIKAHRSDVLVGKTVDDMLPGGAPCLRLPDMP